MKILLIGGLGFQGVHLTKELLKEGHEVIILNTPSVDSKENYGWLLDNIEICGGLDIIPGSITDTEVMERVIPQVDLIFHLAAKINVDESIESPIGFYETNIKGTINVLELARKNNTRVIIVSSCEAIGPGNNLHEHSELLPNSPYAASKACAERIAYSYNKTYGLPVDIIRPFNIFGNRQKEGKFGAVIPKFFKAIINNEEITIFGDGKQERELIYIDDIIKAYIKIIEKENKKDCNTYVFGSHNKINIIDLANLIAKVVGKEPKIKFIEARAGEVPTFSSLKTITDYFPDIKITSLEEGLQEYYKQRCTRNEYCNGFRKGI